MASDPIRKPPPGWEAQAARFALISDVVLLIARSKDLEQLLLQAVNRIKWVFDFNRCTLALVDKDGASYSIRTLLETRRGLAAVEKSGVAVDAGLHGKVIASGQPWVEADISQASSDLPEPVDPALADGSTRSAIGLPLRAYGRVIGAILFSATRANVFSEDDVKLALQFATHLGLAIDRFRQSEALREAERKASSARKRLYEAIESVSEGFVLYDKDDRLVECNSQFKTFFFEAADVVEAGVPFEKIARAVASSGLVSMEGDDLETWIANRMETHRNPAGPHELRLAKDIWIKVSEKRTAEGGLVGIYTDITEIKQRESQLGDLVDRLAEARDVAMEATRAKSQFLANMSHELRTPLNAVIGIAEMLQEDAEDDGLEDFIDPLQRINRAGKHLLGLINDVLDLSKIEAGRLDLVEEVIDVRVLAADIGTMAQPLAEKKRNAVETQIDEDVASIRADSMRLRQIVFNLLSNACKFTDGGKVSLNISMVEHMGRSAVAFAVRDTGIGISEEQIGRLFREFSQADATTTRKFGGTGLGLVISRRLAQLMGGEILVESVPGDGSTFTAVIPVEAHSAPVENDASEIGPGAPRRTARRNDAVALVIDDDAESRDLIRRMIEREGVRVETVANGEDGLRLARQIKPDLITLDILMPGKDGWSVLGALRADPELSATPVIIVSILDESRRGYALGATGFLTKPVDREGLRAAIGRLFGAAVGAKALVVEDDDAARSMLRRLLVGEGCLVTEAEDGRAALDAVAEFQPDLILLDLMMPNMDGFSFIEELRRRKNGAEIPVIVVTAADLSEDDAERLSGEVQDIVRKSGHDLEQLAGVLRERVSEIIGRNGVREGDQA
jgi:adenylate cyclase